MKFYKNLKGLSKVLLQIVVFFLTSFESESGQLTFDSSKFEDSVANFAIHLLIRVLTLRKDGDKHK